MVYNQLVKEMKKIIELVGYGHADRFADYISERILDEHLKQDQFAKIAVEVMVTRNKIFLGGEITSKAKINYEKIIFSAIKKVYGEKWWPNYKKIEIINNIQKQSNELNKLQTEKEIVAGDQGVIYGYYNHHQFTLIKNLYQLMEKIQKHFAIAPDWKLLYILNHELSISFCGIKKEEYSYLENFIWKHNQNLKFKSLIINPGGEWLICGPRSDTGLTGRKLMMESFNTGLPHGGGAFCGKDISKVDKTASLWATYLAYQEYKNNKNRNINKDYIVRFVFKIGDRKPIVYTNFETETLKIESLNQFIISKKLLQKNDWSDSVLKGGIVYLIKKIK